MSVENNWIAELAAPATPLSSDTSKPELIYVGFWRRLGWFWDSSGGLRLGIRDRDMTESELTALLDAHDVLVKSCVDSVLPFAEFLALYNDFPHVYALDGHEATPEEHAILQRSGKRIAFHFQVASVLSGLCSETDSENGLYREVGVSVRRWD